MKDRKKVNAKQILKGAFSGSGVLILLIFFSVFFIYKTGLNEISYIPLFSLCVIISGFISGYISTRKLRKNGIVNGVLSSAIPNLSLFIFAIIINKSFYIFLIIPILMLTVSGICGGIAAVNIKRKKIR